MGLLGTCPRLFPWFLWEKIQKKTKSVQSERERGGGTRPWGSGQPQGPTLAKTETLFPAGPAEGWQGPALSDPRGPRRVPGLQAKCNFTETSGVASSPGGWPVAGRELGDGTGRMHRGACSGKACCSGMLAEVGAPPLPPLLPEMGLSPADLLGAPAAGPCAPAQQWGRPSPGAHRGGLTPHAG